MVQDIYAIKNASAKGGMLKEMEKADIECRGGTKDEA
jgi:hypothetical protein